MHALTRSRPRVLAAKLEHLDDWNAARRRRAAVYDEAFETWSG